MEHKDHNQQNSQPGEKLQDPVCGMQVEQDSEYQFDYNGES